MSRHIYGPSILEWVVETAVGAFFVADRFVADWRRR